MRRGAAASPPSSSSPCSSSSSSQRTTPPLSAPHAEMLHALKSPRSQAAIIPALLFLLQLAALQPTAAVPSVLPTPTLAPAGTVHGTLRQLAGGLRSSDEPFNQLYLETAHHGHLHLRAAPDMADMHVGADVRVQYSGLQGRRLVVDKISSRRHDRRLLQQSRATAPKGNITMIVFIMDLSLCGTAKPAATPQEVSGFLQSSQPQNLAAMYRTCSMGAVQLDTANSTVITVPFPCSGNLPDGSSFTTDTCDNNNVVNWQTYAAVYATKQGIQLNRYHHRVLLLPKQFHSIMSNCNFDGLASQGRWAFDNNPALGNSWGYGLVWMCGDCWSWVPTYWHELGHNFGARHARNEFGPLPDQLGNTSDYASAMGSWGADEARCHNAGQLWTMGWSTPAVQLDLSSLVPGSPAQLISIPLQLKGPTGVQISAGGGISFVLSLRGMLPPYDRPFLHMNLTGAVAVHRTPSNVQYTDTALVGLLTGRADTWVEPQSLLSATVVAFRNSAVTVAVCRRTALQAACYSMPGLRVVQGSTLAD